ncbi:CAP domain-containing protein [Streptomyces sp. WMMC500]|uniref:CAP domain-containing protein n=1 Tax=Streptomyces sp. WMMC500 TaxID=3015154 RepID=UPI00248ABC1E|nr:CAP domain-containing protein [Streptomyces sp. WMMC500]WBB62803.1 CAP domain-containing protein [Streptomyces sp. WMMC500]
MGRHRRSEPQPPTGRRRDTPGAYDSYDGYSPYDGYDAHDGYGPYGGHRTHGTGRSRGQHRRQSPARAGMLGTSAALAVGAVAMASGVLGSGFDLDRGGGGPAGHVEAGDPPSPGTHGSSELPTQEASPSASGGSDRPESRTPEAKKAGGKDDEDRRESKSASPSTSAPEREKRESADPSSTSPSPSRTASKTPSPTKTKSAEPTRSAKPTATTDATTAAEAEVLRLVNQERAQAGCRPLTNDPELAKLAGDYSQDMAARGFFDHTDPDGNDPWERAQEYGIADLGGENIARGQANAQSVMDAWMNSEGHRANILNCDFRTLGVGAHFADGGPWWTQNFGF